MSKPWIPPKSYTRPQFAERTQVRPPKSPPGRKLYYAIDLALMNPRGTEPKLKTQHKWMSLPSPDNFSVDRSIDRSFARSECCTPTHRPRLRPLPTLGSPGRLSLLGKPNLPTHPKRRRSDSDELTNRADKDIQQINERLPKRTRSTNDVFFNGRTHDDGRKNQNRNNNNKSFLTSIVPVVMSNGTPPMSHNDTNVGTPAMFTAQPRSSSSSSSTQHHQDIQNIREGNVAQIHSNISLPMPPMPPMPPMMPPLLMQQLLSGNLAEGLPGMDPEMLKLMTMQAKILQRMQKVQTQTPINEDDKECEPCKYPQRHVKHTCDRARTCKESDDEDDEASSSSEEDDEASSSSEEDEEDIKSSKSQSFTQHVDLSPAAQSARGAEWKTPRLAVIPSRRYVLETLFFFIVTFSSI